MRSKTGPKKITDRSKIIIPVGYSIRRDQRDFIIEQAALSEINLSEYVRAVLDALMREVKNEKKAPTEISEENDLLDVSETGQNID